MNSNDRALDAPLDLLIRGGWVVDGTAYKASQRDVGVRDGRLVVRPGVGELTAGEVIDAAGLMVAPGFIDIHGHSDFNALMYPRADSKLLSGVTTEVSGNCGYGAFPLLGDVLARRKREYEHRGLKIDWQRPDEFFARAEASPSSVNRIVLVGHENVRAGVMGYADARADDGQIKEMAKLVADTKASESFALDMRRVGDNKLVVDLDKGAGHAVSDIRLLYDHDAQRLGESDRVDRERRDPLVLKKSLSCLASCAPSQIPPQVSDLLRRARCSRIFSINSRSSRLI